MANILFSILSTFDDKGLKKGKKQISAFDKQVKKFGKTFAGVFGAQALFNYSKNAVKAFMADEKAAKALELQLKNTGFAFSAPSVEYFIANLQKTTGVLDDQLRPAFQQLLTVTGSITKSQEALNVALDISAATGKSLTEVSAALTRGFSGNTAGLSRLGAGISKATLKTGDMDKILGELQQKFTGQSAARLDTYAGKMDLLKVASENAAEIIGKGLLDSLQALAKDESIENVSASMEGLATDIANATYGMALLIGKTKEFLGLGSGNAGGGSLLGLIPVLGPYLESISKYGATEAAKPKSNFTYDLGSSATKDIERAKLILEGNKQRTKELKLIKEKNALEALKMKYDVERIGLQAALNAATDEDTKLRLAEKLAILDGNAARAQEYLADRALLDISNLELLARLEQINALKELTKGALQAAFAMGAVQRGEYTTASTQARTAAGMSYTGATAVSAPIMMGAVQRGEYTTVNVNVAGSVLTDDDLTNTIQRTILQINKQGRGTTPAGGLSGGT